MEATDSQTRVIVQTAYEKLIERGRAKGEARGLAKGKARGLAKGKARGLVEGKARGLVEGKARGLAEGKADMLVQLIEARFGAAPSEVLERIREASVDQLDRWARRLFTVTSLDELFVD